jgi:hypothetical protein
MATTLLDVVKNNSELYAMLKQEPSSKLLRNYLKQHLGLQSIPVLVTIEEWEAWLAQTTTIRKEKEQKAKQPTFLQECLSLVPGEEITASQRRTFHVSGEITSTGYTTTDLLSLFERNTHRLSEILEPIFACQTEDDLEDLDTDDIVSDLESLAYEQLEDLLDGEEFPVDLGDLSVSEMYVDAAEDVEADGLYTLLEDFVAAVIEHRRGQIANE